MPERYDSSRRALFSGLSPFKEKPVEVILRNDGPVLVSGDEAAKYTRREAMGKLGKGLLGVMVAAHAPRLLEFVPTVTDSTIGFTKEQQARLENPETKSAVLVLGGATVKSAEEITEGLTPALEPLGAVGYVDYAKHGFDVGSIADEILELKNKHGIETISIYGHSEGPQVAGLALEKITDKVKLGTVFLDSTPVTTESLDPSPALGAKLSEALDPVGLGMLSVIVANYYAYDKNVFKMGTAPPDLLQAQGLIFRYSTRAFGVLKYMAERDDSQVIFLTPEDPEKETVLDPAKAEKELREFFPKMDVAYVKDAEHVPPNSGKNVGKQGHANPGEKGNAIGYRKAITESLQKAS